MAQYALVNGVLAPVSGLGGRGNCHDPLCGWDMIAKPGNGTTVPHWAHKPGSKHALGNGEKGEWHQEVQNLFRLAGAATEVEMPSHDGTRQHRADVVCANGRIIEAQTLFLEPGELASREATYGTMAWLYDAHDTHKWFVINDPNDPARFDWGKPNRRFMAHTKPVFFDTPDGVWQLERMSIRHEKGRKGRPIYEGVRRLVAADLLDFVTKVTDGKQFGPPPVLAAVDVKKKRGTKFRTVQPVDEWLAANPGCDYVPEQVPEVAPPPPTPTIAQVQAAEVAAAARRQSYMTELEERRAAEIRQHNNRVALASQPIAQPLKPQPPAAETDWSLLAGMCCDCASGCTDVRWGDGGTCKPTCQPCQLMRGTTYTSPRRKAAT